MDNIKMFRNSKLTLLFLGILFLIFITPIFLFGTSKGFQEPDQLHHIHLIKIFAGQPLAFQENYKHTGVYMAPGHHFLLALTARLFSVGDITKNSLSIRAVNTLFGFLFLVTAWRMISLESKQKTFNSLALTFPILCSYYFLSSTVWVSTDNAAMVWVCSSLICLLISRRQGSAIIWAGVFAGLAIFWRQVHFWLLIPILVRANKLRKRPNFKLIWLLAPMIPVFVGVCFLKLWGGVVPSYVPKTSVHLHITAILYVSSLFGVYSLFFMEYIWSDLVKIIRQFDIGFFVSLFAGALFAVLIPSSYDRNSVRWGGVLWNLARDFPVFYNRSIVFLILCPLGTAFFYIWLKTAYSEKGRFTVLVFISWLSGILLMPYLWQRYYETMILLILALLASSRKMGPNSKAHYGPVVLSILLFIFSLVKLCG